MIRPLFSWILFGLVVAGTWIPRTALAQAEFGWQIQGGGVQPTSAYVHNGIRLETAAAASEGEQRFSPSLVDQYNRIGFRVGTALLFYPFEIRYDFTYLGWDRLETVCSGSSDAVILPSGEIDDATVSYRCGEEPISSSLSGQDLEPVQLHVISAGYRYYLPDLGGWLRPFLAVAPGIALSTYTDQAPDAGLDLGFHLGGGLGLDIGLSQTFTLATEARYNLLVHSPPTRMQDAANRAVARGETSLEAVLDLFHYVTFDLGLRLDFR